jgi:hypothetical protein
MSAEEEIADSLSDALRGTDEAYGIACAEWGEKDPRSERILNAWAEVETVFREFHK